MDNRMNILDWMKSVDRPVTLAEVSEELEISKHSAAHFLNSLVEEGKLVTSTDLGSNERTTRRVRYYTLATGIESEDRFKKMEVDFSVRIEEKINNLEEKMTELENKEKRFYSEIISIMSVFVAVFAMIVVNVDVLQGAISTEMEAKELLIRIGIVDISLVVTIGIMLWMVKKFIVCKRKEKGKKKK